jgi:hypothetical protein
LPDNYKEEWMAVKAWIPLWLDGRPQWLGSSFITSVKQLRVIYYVVTKVPVISTSGPIPSQLGKRILSFAKACNLGYCVPMVLSQ